MKKNIIDYDYNTQRVPLVIREYGRHVQGMVDYAASVDDREKRTRLVQGIIDLMGQMNPHLRNVDEFKHKLWDHIYIISGGKLDADSPYPKPDLEKIRSKPKHMGYPNQNIRFKHYGKNVENLIKKAVEMEDEEKKKEFAECIGNYMKLVHRNWNKDNANDEVIKQDIKVLSKGALELPEDTNLDSLTRSTKPKRSTGEFKKGGRHGRRDRDRDGGSGGGRGHHRDRNRRNKGRN